MTISTTESTAVFNGNGVTTVFPFSFPFIQDSDLKVYQEVVATGVVTEITTGFTKVGAGSNSGGSVDFIAAPADGIKIIVSRELDLTQLTGLRNQGSFFPEVHEDAFDRLTMQIQQLNSGVNGAIRVAVGDPEPARLPSVTMRRNMAMGFDSVGDPVVLSVSSNDNFASGFVSPVHDFGAAGDGVTDDTAAVQAAFASGSPVWLGDYSYLITDTLTVVHPAIIKGASRGRTSLIFQGMGGYAGKDCISIQLTAGSGYRKTSTLSDFSIVFKGANAKGGIVTPQGGNIWLTYHPTYVIERVAFLGDVTDPTMFGLYDYTAESVIRMGESSGSVIRDCQINGNYDFRLNPATQQTTAGAIRFDATLTTTGGGGVLLPVVDHCYGHFQGTAISIGYRVSQPVICNSQFHRNYYGINSPQHAGDNVSLFYGSDEMHIHHCNINSQRIAVLHAPGGFLSVTAVRTTRATGGFDHTDAWYGFYLSGLLDLKMVDTRAYVSGGTYTNEAVGYYIDAIDKVYLAGMFVRSEASGGIDFGVILNEPKRVVISGLNLMGTITYGVEFRRVVETVSDIVMSGVLTETGVATLYSYTGTITRSSVKVLDIQTIKQGMDVTAVSVSAAGTTTMTVGTGVQARRFAFATGGGTYTHNLDFSNTGAKAGDEFLVNLSMVATNPTVVFRDGSGVTLLSIPPTGATQRFYAHAVYTGSAWRMMACSTSLI